MTKLSAGVFTIEYTLRTSAEPGHDIQFGMDFTITQDTKGKILPLTQLIFPATAVGNNHVGVWNVDNHQAPSTDPKCLIFNGADHGVLTDRPTEITHRSRGILSTKFAVYRVDVANGTVQINGVSFGYRVDSGAAHPETIFTGLQSSKVTGEQKGVILARCSIIKFA